MTRITFNELKRRAAAINAAHNVGAKDIGAIQIYRDKCRRRRPPIVRRWRNAKSMCRIS